MDYLAYLIKQYVPFLFPAVASIARLLTTFRYGKCLMAARAQGTLDGQIDGKPAQIRPLGTEDVEGLGGFLRTLPDHHLEHFHPHDFDEPSIRLVLGSRAFVAYGLFVERRLLGYALLKVSPTGRAFLGRLLAPELTGLGLGSFLSRYLYWQCELAGVRPTSTINRHNLSSLESHRAVAQFEVIRELPNDYLLIEFLVKVNEPPKLDAEKKIN